MFQPNSIRSLISKRNSSKAQSASSSQEPAHQHSLDPDYDSIMQVKLITKQIESKIQNIRQWRQQQKQLLQQKLKFNAQLAHVTNSIHMQYLQKQSQREQKQLKDILQKLKNSENQQIIIKQNEQLYDSERIFNVLNQTDKWRERLKYSNDIVSNSEGIEANYSGLVNEMDQIGHIFINSKDDQGKEGQKVDAKLLQKQMDQIENQLREIQDLLADEKEDKKTSKNKQSGE